MCLQALFISWTMIRSGHIHHLNKVICVLQQPSREEHPTSMKRYIIFKAVHSYLLINLNFYPVPPLLTGTTLLPWYIQYIITGWRYILVMSCNNVNEFIPLEWYFKSYLENYFNYFLNETDLKKKTKKTEK